MAPQGAAAPRLGTTALGLGKLRYTNCEEMSNLSKWRFYPWVEPAEIFTLYSLAASRFCRSCFIHPALLTVRSIQQQLASKMFDFRRGTVFCLGHRFSKHNMLTIWGGMAPEPSLATPVFSSESKSDAR